MVEVHPVDLGLVVAEAEDGRGLLDVEDPHGAVAAAARQHVLVPTLGLTQSN